MHPSADFPGKAVASGLQLIGALHYQAEIIQLFRKFNGNPLRGDLIAFGPVKRRPKKRTAGAAFQTGVDGHFRFQAFGQKLVRYHNHGVWEKI
jgi:hypothetical protein